MIGRRSAEVAALADSLRQNTTLQHLAVGAPISEMRLQRFGVGGPALILNPNLGSEIWD